MLWLGECLALAFDSCSILQAKLQAEDGFPCRLRGTVTMRLDPGEYYLQDQTSGIRVSSSGYQFREADRLDVEGWLYLGDAGEFLMRSTEVWYLGNGPPLIPRLIALPDAYSGGYQGKLVAVRGAVLAVDFGRRFDTISIQQGRTSIRVFYPANRNGHSVFERLYPGMLVAVAGVSVPQTTDPEFDGYQVRLRGPADLEIRPAPLDDRALRWDWAAATMTSLCFGAAAGIWSSRHRRTSRASQVQ